MLWSVDNFTAESINEPHYKYVRLFSNIKISEFKSSHLTSSNKAKAIKDDCMNVPLEIPASKLTNIAIHVRKHMVHCSYGDRIVKITCSKHIDNVCCHIVATKPVVSKTLVRVKKHTETPITSQNWRNIVDIPPEHTAHYKKVINMLEHFRELWD